MKNIFKSRRSTVYSTKGIVSSTQPLANAAGIKILEKGGNCVDASISVAACLAVLEPASTGIGGDCFALFYKNKDKKVYGLNGTGRSASKLNISWIKENLPNEIESNFRFKSNSVLKINIPGAIAGWIDAINKWGSGNVSIKEILEPSIDLCFNGYVVSEISSSLWKSNEFKIIENNLLVKEEDLRNFLPNKNLSEGPNEGQFMTNEQLGNTLKKIANEGKDGFYKGLIAKEIVKELNNRGHPIMLKDLENHKSTFVEPISYEFLDHKLWEIPPNGSGIISLITLGLINNLNKNGIINLDKLEHNSAEYLHLIIECLKIGFKESEEYVNDYEYFKEKYNINEYLGIKTILSDKYLTGISKQFKNDKVIKNEKLVIPNPIFKSDTVYFTVSDKEGNACSFINSLYENFGSGIIIPKHGFMLHNRGGNFSLNKESKNCIEGDKRPYHTIIPGMITKKINNREELYSSFGIMGGYNQPQAQVQVYLNMIKFKMDPQQALDAPRISLFANPKFKLNDKGYGSDGPVSNDSTIIGIEEGIDLKEMKKLQGLGHEVKHVEGKDRKMFGRGQIIRKESKPEDSFLVYSAGSDLRGDGAAVPLV